MRSIEEIKAQMEKRKATYMEFANSDNPELRTAGPFLMMHVENDLRAALTASIPLDRLEAICQAEREGRCVVLPCKAGQTITDSHATDWTITEIDLHMYGNVVMRCGIKGTDAYCAFTVDELGERWFTSHEEGEAARAKFMAQHSRAAAEAALNAKEDGREV